MSTVAKALTLLDLFSEARPALGLTDFQRLTGRDKATVHRHLTALEALGFLEQDEATRAYRLGHALERLATMRHLTVPEASMLAPIVDAISRDLRELVHVTRFAAGTLTPFYFVDLSDQAIRVDYAYDIVLPLPTTSSGKSILAHMKEPAATEIILAQYDRYPDEPLPAKATLRAELAVVETQGYCISRDTAEVGVSSVGIPIFDRTGCPIGGCSVAMPTARVTEELIESCIMRLAHDGPTITERLGGIVPDRIQALWQALAAPAETQRKIA